MKFCAAVVQTEACRHISQDWSQIAQIPAFSVSWWAFHLILNSSSFPRSISHKFPEMLFARCVPLYFYSTNTGCHLVTHKDKYKYGCPSSHFHHTPQAQLCVQRKRQSAWKKHTICAKFMKRKKNWYKTNSYQMIAFQLQYNKCMSPAEQLPIRKSCCITKGNCNYHHHHHHHHYQFTKAVRAIVYALYIPLSFCWPGHVSSSIWSNQGSQVFFFNNDLNIHSKSEKVCGTAFSVKKNCGKSA